MTTKTFNVTLMETRSTIDTNISKPSGENGLSAYEIAVANGFFGSEKEWLDSLVGPPGPAGPKGDTGATGATGPKGEPGEPYVLTEDDRDDITNAVLAALPNTEGVEY